MSSLAGYLEHSTVSGSGTFPTSISGHRFHAAIARARRQWRGSPSGGQTWCASPGISSRIPAARPRLRELAGTARPAVRRPRQSRRRGHARPVLARCGASRSGAGDAVFDDQVETSISRGERVSVVGVDPVVSTRARAPARAGRARTRRFRLLLCHFRGSSIGSRTESFDLILAGHLHAGQICLPTPRRRVTLAHPRARSSSGLYKTKAGVMHISPGTGTTFVPFRFFARPEVTELVLRRRH